MEINILSGSNAPESTNVIMGQFIKTNGEFKDINVSIETASVESKAIYDNFFNMTGKHASLSIINSPYNFEGNHVSPDAVDLESVVIDYTILSANDKSIIDAAFALLESIES